MRTKFWRWSNLPDWLHVKELRWTDRLIVRYIVTTSSTPFLFPFPFLSLSISLSHATLCYVFLSFCLSVFLQDYFTRLLFHNLPCWSRLPFLHFMKAHNTFVSLCFCLYSHTIISLYFFLSWKHSFFAVLPILSLFLSFFFLSFFLSFLNNLFFLSLCPQLSIFLSLFLSEEMHWNKNYFFPERNEQKRRFPFFHFRFASAFKTSARKLFVAIKYLAQPSFSPTSIIYLKNGPKK